MSLQPTWTVSRRMLAAVVLLSLALLAVGPFTGTAGAAPAAAYTSTNPAVDDPGGTVELCKNGGNTATNCNIYTEKQYVWLDGGPVEAQLSDGEYFFAVLNPSGQNDPMDPADLLSTDTTADRTFTVLNGDLTYTGSHLLDSNKIRVEPYANSTNGVYILAICRLVNGAAEDCKFDAFKVDASDPVDPVEVDAIFTGVKWRDDNADGVFDATEVPLLGWDIDIFSVDDQGDLDPTNDVWTLLTTETTLADGSYFFQSTPVTQGTSELFAVCERQQAGWSQTAPSTTTYADAAASATGGAVVTPTTDASSAPCYAIETDGSASATASLLDFGNVATSDLSGAKYFDADMSGTRADDGVGGWTEPGIASWPIEVRDASDTVVCSTTTDSNGDWSCPGLTPGTYSVREVQATNTAAWVQTGNTTYQGSSPSVTGLASFVYTVTVAPDAPSTADTLFFGNVCVNSSTPGGRTIGFWSNKNGQARFDEQDRLALVALSLRKAGGADFDPPTYAKYKSWLLDASGTNMAYMLSAQLSATVLNVRNGFTDPDAQVDGSGTTVQDVIDAAQAALAADGLTLSGDPNRAEQNRLKNILDKINNNKTFTWTVDDPSDCATPVFP